MTQFILVSGGLFPFSHRMVTTLHFTTFSLVTGRWEMGQYGS